MLDTARLLTAYETARRDLVAWSVPAGHWTGRLSSSALSTATATSALALVGRQLRTVAAGRFRDEAGERRLSELVVAGLRWLARAQNADGGWGDTEKSDSNIATTMLALAAFHLTGVPADHPNRVVRAERYVEAQGGVAGLWRRYGKDKTFAVPILTNCALAGLVPWHLVPPLPFELACLPQAWYRFLRLPVVSYAIPALVAIGEARYFHRKPSNPLARLVRGAAAERSLKVLEQMQPASGGFLEATPLTSFVVLSLASIGQARHPVARRGVEFLVASARDDGSWPIDTNLATWVTTLATNALAAGGEDVSRLCNLDWLLACQHRERHPFTGAAPGGWGWSDLAGAVPDADDTAGALLALAAWRSSARQAAGGANGMPPARQGSRRAGAAGVASDLSPEEAPSRSERLEEAAAEGVTWLLDLQNSDGGWPTFCRGWARLPFDRSGADLTAHALRALGAWREPLAASLGGAPPALRTVLKGRDARILSAVGRGWEYLGRSQRADGSWVPLWFGNQHDPREENPVYGTARVLSAYRDLGRLDSPPARRGLEWLAARQNPDGGWGGGPSDGSSVEETALAVEALLAAGPSASLETAASEGVGWLVEAVESNRHRESSPIGFYFAKLWYYEALYPLVFAVSALGQAVARRSAQDRPTPAQTHESAAARSSSTTHPGTS